MNFKAFQATGRDVDDLRAFDEVLAQLGEDRTEPMPGRLYLGALYIEGNAGAYCLTVGNFSEAGTDLAAMERALFDFAITEGYAEGPTTEEELIEALRGLMEYVGGWDSPAGHPCRVAADLLARVAE
jgi:hypothetical protein